MRSTTLLFLSLLSSAFAFEVTAPATRQGWTNNGPQTVTWKRVSTDATNFTIVLTNQNRALLAADVVLATAVDATSASSINVNPPSGGWPTPGANYRINLVKSTTEQNSIYAQSTEFNIVSGPATVITANNSTTTTSSGGSANPGPGSSGFGGSGVTFGNKNESTTADGTQEPVIAPGKNNGASSSMTLSAGLFAGVVALAGSALL